MIRARAVRGRRSPRAALAAFAALAPLAMASVTSRSLAASCAMPAAQDAQQELARGAAAVTAVSGTSVYIDAGRDEHVQVGDTAIVVASGIEGVVRSVARHSARVELAPGSPAVDVGARVEVLVPRERLAPSEPTPPGAAAPSTPEKPPPLHPPWTQPPEAWSTDRPLLEPAFGLEPAERPRDVHARAWLDLHDTHDDIGGSKDYFLGRTGADVRVDNPFGRGGTFEVDGEVVQRIYSFTDQPGVSDTDLLLRQLSYAVGDTREESSRLEVGRFYSHEFAELGTVDGVEWSRRTDGGSRFGFSAGGLPSSFPDTRVFEDYGVALFGRYATDESERLTFGGAVQGSWHEGVPDRHLVVLEGAWRPAPEFSWSTSAWIDHYDSRDTEKSSGLELTEVSTYARWTIAPDWGSSVRVSRRRYPQVLRDEFDGITPALLRDGRVERGALAVWHAFTDRVRADARVDAWEDEDDRGTGGELGATLRDVLYEHGTVGASLFHTDGSFSSGDGVRASATRAWERTLATLAYEYADFDQKGFLGADANLAHQALFGSLDLPLGESWDLTLTADTRFGDEHGAWSVGMTFSTQY